MSDYEQKRDELVEGIIPIHVKDKDFVKQNKLDTRSEVKMTIDSISLQAQTDGVAWAISIIDELHIGTPGSETTDRLMKGIKNNLRNRYEETTGIDPAPNYPVKVELRKPGDKRG